MLPTFFCSVKIYYLIVSNQNLKIMNNYHFYKNYSDELTCVEFLFSFYKDVVKTCPKCGSEKIKWTLKNKGWRCNTCTSKISLKSVSFLRDSNKKYSEWLEIIFLLLNSKKALSISEIVRLSRQTCYNTVYHMVRKIDNELGFINQLEASEFKTIIPFDSEDNPSADFPSELTFQFSLTKSRTKDKIRLVLSQERKKKILNQKCNCLNTKKYSFPKVLSIGIDLLQCSLPLNEKNIKTKWRNTIKENILRVINGIHHEIKGFHLQAKLDEYSFKYNYRHSKKPKLLVFFQRLIQSIGKIQRTHIPRLD